MTYVPFWTVTHQAAPTIKGRFSAQFRGSLPGTSTHSPCYLNRFKNAIRSCPGTVFGQKGAKQAQWCLYKHFQMLGNCTHTFSNMPNPLAHSDCPNSARTRIACIPPQCLSCALCPDPCHSACATLQVLHTPHIVLQEAEIGYNGRGASGHMWLEVWLGVHALWGKGTSQASMQVKPASQQACKQVKPASQNHAMYHSPTLGTGPVATARLTSGFSSYHLYGHREGGGGMGWFDVGCIYCGMDACTSPPSQLLNLVSIQLNNKFAINAHLITIRWLHACVFT